MLANHPDAALIQSPPGVAVVLTAELIANIGDIRRADSGDTALKRMFYQSAFVALATPAA